MLVQPAYGDLGYASQDAATALILGMSKERPDWQFVTLCPPGDPGLPYRNVVRVPQDFKHDPILDYDGIWFDRLCRRMGFDLILGWHLECVGHLRFAGTQTFEAIGRSIVIAAHPPGRVDWQEDPLRHMLRLGGSLIAHRNMFASAHQQRQFLEAASSTLHEQALRQIEEQSIIINCHEPQTGAQAFAAMAESLNQWDPAAAQDAIAYLASLLGKSRGMDIRDFCNLLYKAEINGRGPFGSQTWALPKVMRVIRHVGGTVRIERGQQRVYPPRSYA